MLSELLEIYARTGYSLQSIGLKEAALPINIARDAVDIMEKMSIIISGGDVYLFINNKMHLSYDSWFYDGLIPRESAEKAKNFLLNEKRENAYISIVCNFS